MMRSLFSGVSGLKTHQTGMDVIGNNIANVNTTGFKSSRATFADMFSQTLTAASAGNGDVVGGTNPKQIGLGSTVASIDLLFTDGSTQSTGKNTDMALQGNGLFVVKQGDQTYYTRNGDFSFDANGNFVNTAGLYVQGWKATDGQLPESTTAANMSSLQLQAGTVMEPKLTSKTIYTNNLNSAAATIQGMTVLDGNGNTVSVSSLDSTQWAVGEDHSATIENMDVSFAGNITIESATGQYTMGNNYAVSNVTVMLSNGDTLTVPATSTARYTIGSAPASAIKELNTTNNDVTYKDGATVSKSNSAYTLTLNNGDTVKVASTGKIYTKGSSLSDTVTEVKGATVTLDSGDVLTNNSGTTYKAALATNTGDVLTISANSTIDYKNNEDITPIVKSITGMQVTLSDGSVITSTKANIGKYTIGKAVGDKVASISGLPKSSIATITANDNPTVSEISGTVTSDDGTDTFDTKTSGAYLKASSGLTTSGLTLTDENGSTVTVSSSDKSGYKAGNVYNATSPKSVGLKMSDGSTVTETSGAYNIGYSMPVATTVKAYDTLGNEHNVTLYFTKTRTDSHTGNQWTVSINPDGSGSTKIKEKDGTTTTATMNDVTLQFDTNGNYKSGSTSTNLILSNGAELNQSIAIDLGQLTQFASGSTVTSTSDGNATGTLASVSIDQQGRIIGSYTNDVKRVEGQVAVAQFTNAAGLTKSGNSLYQQSNNSGTLTVGNNTDLGVALSTSALEMSNVDIANEFSNMITTQRGFQSNSKIITVSDEMLETLINMKR
jgi:flagellar hook protein FlgE